VNLYFMYRSTKVQPQPIHLFSVLLLFRHTTLEKLIHPLHSIAPNTINQVFACMCLNNSTMPRASMTVSNCGEVMVQWASLEVRLRGFAGIWGVLCDRPEMQCVVFLYCHCLLKFDEMSCVSVDQFPNDRAQCPCP
jgi:hypothetical protein